MERTMRTAGPVLLALMAVILAVAAPVGAQSFSQSRRGDGTITRDRSSDERVDSVSVNLKNNGDIVVVFYGERKRHTYEGKWTRGRYDQLTVRMDADGDDDRGTVTGDLHLTADRRGFERLTLSGTAAGRRTYLHFESTSSGRDWDDSSAWDRDRRRGDSVRRDTWDRDRGDTDSARTDTMNRSQSGSGKGMVSGRDTYDFNRANVVIRSDRDVRVTFFGDTTLTYTGRVTRRSGDDIYVSLEGRVLGDPTSLEGFINIRRTTGGFDRISLNSRRGRTLNINFTAR